MFKKTIVLVFISASLILATGCSSQYSKDSGFEKAVDSLKSQAENEGVLAVSCQDSSMKTVDVWTKDNTEYQVVYDDKGTVVGENVIFYDAGLGTLYYKDSKKSAWKDTDAVFADDEAPGSVSAFLAGLDDVFGKGFVQVEYTTPGYAAFTTTYAVSYPNGSEPAVALYRANDTGTLDTSVTDWGMVCSYSTSLPKGVVVPEKTDVDN